MKLHQIRKKLGMTQFEVAELAELSDRTYADIERGSVNMRVETILRICDALQITPDSIFTSDNPTLECKKEKIIQQLDSCSPSEQETALKLMSVYLDSLRKS